MSERKALLRDYKERKVEVGIYAVRCVPTGQAWVGVAPDLSKRQNRVWFSLRLGSHRETTLQAAWNTHGADAFVFEAVEVVDIEGLDGAMQASKLKDRCAHWVQTLNATGLN